VGSSGATSRLTLGTETSGGQTRTLRRPFVRNGWRKPIEDGTPKRRRDFGATAQPLVAPHRWLSALDCAKREDVEPAERATASGEPRASRAGPATFKLRGAVGCLNRGAPGGRQIRTMNRLQVATPPGSLL